MTICFPENCEQSRRYVGGCDSVTLKGSAWAVLSDMWPEQPEMRRHQYLANACIDKTFILLDQAPINTFNLRHPWLLCTFSTHGLIVDKEIFYISMNKNTQFSLTLHHVKLLAHFLSSLHYSLSGCDWSMYLCVPFSYLCVCQRCAPAVYLSFSKCSPNVGANFSVEFPPPDTRWEGSRRSRSREKACVVN